MALAPCWTDFGVTMLNNMQQASTFVGGLISAEIHCLAEIISFTYIFSDYCSKK